MELEKDTISESEYESESEEADPRDVESYDESLSLPEIILQAQLRDDFCTETKESLCRQDRIGTRHVSLAYCTVDEAGYLRYKGAVWVPESARTRTIREAHTQLLAGHPGVARTLALLKRQYYWPRMDLTIRRYIRNCKTCRRSRPSRDAKHGVLNPLPIPQQPWQDISMDFVTGLPLINGCNALLVVVCRFSKEKHYIECFATDEGTSAEATARLLLRNVIKYYSLFDSFVSNRRPQFVNEM